MSLKPSILPLCVTCGTQYDVPESEDLANCKICDDPRQFVPATGQAWTTLDAIREKHHNEWEQDSADSSVWSIWTEPKFAIGQRAFLLETSNGNILWDIVALLDQPLVDFVKSKGGLKSIVISHPHYYTTYVEWGETFNCPVYLAAEDEEWTSRKPEMSKTLRLIKGAVGTAEVILPGISAIKVGGHFPGSLVLHYEKQLFIADSIVTVPSAYTPHPRPLGQVSYVFQWSIPNSIPLGPVAINKIWEAIRPFEFTTTHGAFRGMDVRDDRLKARMLESMKIQVRSEEYTDHRLLFQ